MHAALSSSEEGWDDIPSSQNTCMFYGHLHIMNNLKIYILKSMRTVQENKLSANGSADTPKLSVPVVFQPF